MPVIPAEALREFSTALFTAAGLPAPESATVSEVLIWAGLRGIDSHGVARIPRYLELLASGEANRAPDLKLTGGQGAVAVLDADRAPGPVALTRAADEALALARTNGIGAVGVRRTVHTGAIGYYTSRIADAGLAGVAFVAGMPMMGYPGVTGAAVATSPFSVAVPVAGRPPVLLDMATASIALGKIAQHRAAGRPLPEGVATTADGTPTTDPALAKMPLPLGGAKGAGMSLAFELITSVLLGEPILSAVHGGDRTHRQSALILALDPAAFGAASDYADLAAGTLAAVEGLPHTGEGPRFPGDRGAAAGEKRAADGIPVAPKVWAELTEAAAALSVPTP